MILNYRSYRLFSRKLFVLFLPRVEKMSGNIFDVYRDVHADNGFVVIRAWHAAFRQNAFLRSVEVLKLEDPEK